MPGKLIMTWDISPEREQEYFEFVVREFLPEVQKLGFQLSDAWVTVYGERPQIMVGATLPSISQVKKVITTDQWAGLINKLMDFVTNFDQKIVNSSGSFQF